MQGRDDKHEKKRAGAWGQYVRAGSPTREQYDKARGLVSVLMEPVEPMHVSYPLSEEDQITLAASRNAFIAHAQSKLAEWDLSKYAVEEKMIEKFLANQEREEAIIIAAVKGGMSLQQASQPKLFCGVA